MDASNRVGNIVAVLEYYGANYVPIRSGWTGMKCPFHEDKNASAGVNTDVGAFKCQACPAQGDVISLIKWREDLDYSGALAKYEEIVGESYGGIRRPAKRQRRRPLSEEPVSYERSGGFFSTGVRRRPASGS